MLQTKKLGLMIMSLSNKVSKVEPLSVPNKFVFQYDGVTDASKEEGVSFHEMFMAKKMEIWSYIGLFLLVLIIGMKIFQIVNKKIETICRRNCCYLVLRICGCGCEIIAKLNYLPGSSDLYKIFANGDPVNIAVKGFMFGTLTYEWEDAVVVSTSGHQNVTLPNSVKLPLMTAVLLRYALKREHCAVIGWLEQSGVTNATILDM